jgi:Protein of unknown function (DUF2905)
VRLLRCWRRPDEKTMPELGRAFVVLGGVLMVVGLVMVGLGKLHVPLGRLPGDLKWQGRGWSVSFPLASSILLSVLLSLLFWAVGRTRR